MLIFLYSISIASMVCLPVALAAALRRRVQVPWLLFGVGILTFAGSQAVHLPLNHWLARLGALPQTGLEGLPVWRTALLLGLTAGVCEELARAAGFALLRRFRRVEDGLMLGLGHGGIEMMVVGGVLTAATLSSLLPLVGTDPAALGLPPAQTDALARQLALLAEPAVAGYALLERGIALLAHLAFSLLVLQGLRKRKAGYVALAVGYHAAVDFLAASYALGGLPVTEPWQLEGLFALGMLPGWAWAARQWREMRRGQPAPGGRVPLWQEWALFGVALRKELLQQVRTKRLLVVAAVFGLFGLVSPLLAKFTPEILRSIEGAEQFAALIPEPVMADAMAQYVKNLTQFGFILAVFLGMGAVAGEKEMGTAPMILSKPLPRWAFVVSKFAAQTVVYLVAWGLAAPGAYTYTWILFGPPDVAAFVGINALLFLWLLTFVAVTLVGSTLGNSTGAAAGWGLAGAVGLLLAGTLPVVGPLAPGGLVAWAGQLGAGDAASSNGGAVALGVVVILVCLVLAVGVFERQEL